MSSEVRVPRSMASTLEKRAEGLAGTCTFARNSWRRRGLNPQNVQTCKNCVECEGAKEKVAVVATCADMDWSGESAVHLPQNSGAWLLSPTRHAFNLSQRSGLKVMKENLGDDPA